MTVPRSELPPRARRIPYSCRLRRAEYQNYLRVRGEYASIYLSQILSWELPPRARRIPYSCRLRRAEYQNYLRVRGEYSGAPRSSVANLELPPRARRIHTLYYTHPTPAGTTSACAENTPPLMVRRRSTRNYLRVRGEYSCSSGRRCPQLELPPRARRIPKFEKVFGPQPGTTSACAENTVQHKNVLELLRNYLRVRGEYCRALNTGMTTLELPPRARRIRPVGVGPGG